MKVEILRQLRQAQKYIERQQGTSVPESQTRLSYPYHFLESWLRARPEGSATHKAIEDGAYLRQVDRGRPADITQNHPEWEHYSEVKERFYSGVGLPERDKRYAVEYSRASEKFEDVWKLATGEKRLWRRYADETDINVLQRVNEVVQLKRQHAAEMVDLTVQLAKARIKEEGKGGKHYLSSPEPRSGKTVLLPRGMIERA